MTNFRTYDSGQSASLPTRREFILPEIAYVNPNDTPIYSILSRPYTPNTLAEWVMGDLNFDFSDTSVSASIEGIAASAIPTSYNKRTRLGTHLMINTDLVQVTRTQRQMDEVGVADEYAQQIWEKSLNLAKKNEKNFLWSEDNAGDATTARKSSGFWDYLTAFGNATSTVSFNGYSVPVEYSTYLDETAAPMTRDRLNTLMDKGWQQGLNFQNAITFVGSELKKIISGFGMVYSGSGATLSAAPLNERNIPAAARTLIDAIDIYEGDFGTLYVNKNRYLTGTSTVTINSKSIVPANSMMIFEPSYFQIGELQPLTHVPLAKDGDYTQGMLVCEYCLICRNPKAIVGALNAA